MEEKTKVKIVRNHCLCSGCQEQGEVWVFDDIDGWCLTISVVTDYDLWCTVVEAIKADDKYEIVEGDNENNRRST